MEGLLCEAQILMGAARSIVDGTPLCQAEAISRALTHFCWSHSKDAWIRTEETAWA